LEVSIPGAAPPQEDVQGLDMFTVGMEVEGTVTRKMPFGVFLDVGASRDALWPANQLPKAMAEYEVGEKITGLKITEADPVKSRLSVSTRPGPADLKAGDPIAEGRVTKVMTFGVFVDIGASCEALAPQSLLEKPPSEYQVGDVLTGLSVAQSDASKNQISVGQKDASDLAQESGGITMDDLQVGATVKGIVRQTKDYGVFMDIGLYRRDALLPTSLIGGDRTPEAFKAGEELEVYVAAVDKETNRVTLSMDEPPEGGFQTKVRKLTADWVPPGDMIPDPKYWEAQKCHVEENPIDWKEWAQKYPGMITWADKETEVYFSCQGYGFKGCAELQHSVVKYLPVPLHLRRDDAGPPEIPKFDFADYKLGYEHHGIKPEIHVKFRQPPLNNPDYVYKTPKAVGEDEDPKAVGEDED